MNLARVSRAEVASLAGLCCLAVELNLTVMVGLSFAMEPHMPRSRVHLNNHKESGDKFTDHRLPYASKRLVVCTLGIYTCEGLSCGRCMVPGVVRFVDTGSAMEILHVSTPVALF